MAVTLAGRYQIINHLGGGGFGETFVACDTQLPGNPQCVVKKLQPQATDPLTLETARRLFDTEAQVLFRLGTHPQIPQLLAYFEEQQEFYLVQEFIPGHDLGQELKPGTEYPEQQVINLLQEILEILDFVHQQNVIHRDINPQNILRRDDDHKLVLIDFGAVKQISTQVVNPQVKTKITVAIGTPGYVPSEQAHGNPKFSSDIYALGILGIQALTGLAADEIPQDADTNEIIWHNHAQVSPELIAFLDKMVRYDFRQRYPSAAAALQAIKDLHKPRSGTVVMPFISSSVPQVKITLQQIHTLLKLAVISAALTGLGTVGWILAVNSINANNAKNLYEQGTTFYDLRRYQEALAVYEKSIAINANEALVWIGKGKALNELKRYQDALEAFDQAIQIQPQSKDAWEARGFVLSKLGKHEAAIAAFDKLLKQNYQSPILWNAKGDALLSLSRYEEAIKAYEKAIEIKKDDDQAWYNKAWALQNLKRYDDAIKAYDKVIEIKPDYAKAWYNKGNTWMNLQRYEDAIASYDKAVKFNPKYSQAWFSRGNALINLRRYPEAATSFTEAVKVNHSDYKSRVAQGWSLHQMQRYPEAITAFNRALELKRNDYQLWYNLGNSLYSLQKYPEALAAYKKAVRYKADHHESWYSRGNALLNLKRFPEAVSAYDKAISLKPNYQPAIDARNQAQTQLQATQPQPEPKPIINLPFGR